MRLRAAVCMFMLAIKCAVAQPGTFDPRQPLAQLIQAFQHCTLPTAQRMLSPQMYQSFLAQTGGTGCVGKVTAMGAVGHMQVVRQQAVAGGTAYVIRVNHGTTALDWHMTVNRVTGRIERLEYQVVSPDNSADVRAGRTAADVERYQECREGCFAVYLTCSDPRDTHRCTDSLDRCRTRCSRLPH